MAPEYEGCEKRLDIFFSLHHTAAAGLCLLPFSTWQRVVEAAGAKVLSQVRVLHNARHAMCARSN